jgi:hypothetical protein
LQALTTQPELIAAAVPGDLAAAVRLRERWPAALVAEATLQAELRSKAEAKFPHSQRLLLTRAGLEQATSWRVADLRARRLVSAAYDRGGGRVLDLCCGIGADTLALGRAGMSVVAVDRDPVHAWLARRNATSYEVEVTAVVADVTAGLRIGRADVVHLDPARRDPMAAGGRGRRGGYEPSLEFSTSLGSDLICVKVAPGLDHGEIPAGWEAEWVSEDHELKTAVLWSPALAAAAGNRQAKRRASVLAGDTVTELLADPAIAAPAVEAAGDWILDPDPAVTRAGAVADLAFLLGGWLLDERIAFICLASPVTTPLGRLLRVEDSMPWSVKGVAASLRRLGAGDVQLRRRGLAGDVESLRQRVLPRPPPHAGGPGRRVTVLLTRHRDRPWALVCTDP